MGPTIVKKTLSSGFWNRLLRIGLAAIICLILSLFSGTVLIRDHNKSENLYIRVVMDNNYPPYTFLDEDGNPQGILIDRWRLWEQKTGIKVYLTSMDWEKAIQEMEAGNFDVIDTIFFNEERAKKYDFSPPYVDIEVPIYFQNNISGLTDASSLKGFQVGVKSQDNAINYLESHGIDKFILFNSYESIIKAARDRQLLVFVIDEPPAEYFISKYGIQDHINSSSALYTGQFHRAVKKGSLTLLTTVENGFNLITQAEYNAINTKWMGSQLFSAQYTRYIVISTGLVVFLASLLLLSNRELQRRVKERTTELNALFGAMQDLILVADSNGICRDLPTTTSPLARYPVGGHILDMIPNSEGQQVFEMIRHVLKTQTSSTADFSITINEKSHWFSSVISPLSKNRALLVARDFTQWKNTQEALLESEQRFHIIFENRDVAMILISPQSGKIVDLNQAASEFYGYTVDQMRTMTINQLIQPGYRNSEIDLKMLLEDNQTKFVHVHKLVNGELRTMEVHISPVTINGEELIFSILFDISERKKAEVAVQEKTRELADAYEATLEGWSNALELRERETAGHSKRVVEMTLSICRTLNIPKEELIHIQRGALLHDIGKMGIPDNILLKPGPLTSDEWVIMKQHPLYAFRMLSKIPFLTPALDIPYCHHERWNGSGYPRGLTGENIPLAARIFAIVDVWDALISDRPYRPAWTNEAALNYIHENAGILFDSAVVEIFEKPYKQS